MLALYSDARSHKCTLPRYGPREKKNGIALVYEGAIFYFLSFGRGRAVTLQRGNFICNSTFQNVIIKEAAIL